MTGPALADLMRSPSMHAALSKTARRYTACVETQEEYVQEAWLRIARECEDDDSAAEISREGKLAIQAVYRRRKRDVDKKIGQNVNGIGKEPRVKSGLRHLYRNKYVKVTPEKLDSWLYEGEWAEYGLEKGDCVIRLWHEIVFEEGL